MYWPIRSPTLLKPLEDLSLKREGKLVTLLGKTRMEDGDMDHIKLYAHMEERDIPRLCVYQVEVKGNIIRNKYYIRGNI